MSKRANEGRVDSARRVGAAAFCPVTGRFCRERAGGDPFEEAGLLEITDRSESTREAELFVQGDAAAFELLDEDAYLLRFLDATTGRTRITNRRALSPWLLRGIEASARALGDRLLDVLGIRDLSVELGSGRIWLDVDWFDGEVASVELPRALLLLQRDLSALERCGVVHGGIAPEWIRFRAAGGGAPSLRLGGFGLAWMIAEQRERVFDGLGTSVGDPRYMAPEVADGYPPSAASDCYSAAASLLAAFRAGSPARGPLLGRAAVSARMACPPDRWLPPSGVLAGPPRAQLRAMLDPCPDKRGWLEQERPVAPHSVRPEPRTLGMTSVAPLPAPRPRRKWTRAEIASLAGTFGAVVALGALAWRGVGLGGDSGVKGDPSPLNSAATSSASPSPSDSVCAPPPALSPEPSVHPTSSASAEPCCEVFRRLSESCAPPEPKSPPTKSEPHTNNQAPWKRAVPASPPKGDDKPKPN